MKIIFLDMDNTIAENKTCDNVEFTPGLYLRKRPIQVVIDAITTLYPDIPKIILSKAQGGATGKQEKLDWLSENFPGTFVDFIFLDEGEKYYMKGVYADQWCQLHDIPNEEALVIDDSKQVLQYCKAYGLQTQYPQQVICDYEEYKKQMDMGVSKSLGRNN